MKSKANKSGTVQNFMLVIISKLVLTMASRCAIPEILGRSNPRPTYLTARVTRSERLSISSLARSALPFLDCPLCVVMNGTKNARKKLIAVTSPDKHVKNIPTATLLLLTNNFKLAATTIAQIYRSRWQIELFFKWIKQNLKIKSFPGTSKNAVSTQIWVAMCYYLLLTYIKYQTKYGFLAQSQQNDP